MYSLTLLSFFYCQDGRIDYGEFVAMMTKGNMGVGRRTMRNSLNISMRDAPGAF
jgi:calcium-dependent protein kinase